MRLQNLAHLWMPLPAELLLGMQQAGEVDRGLGILGEGWEGRKEGVDRGVGGRNTCLGVGTDGPRESCDVLRVEGRLDAWVLATLDVQELPPITP